MPSQMPPEAQESPKRMDEGPRVRPKESLVLVLVQASSYQLIKGGGINSNTTISTISASSLSSQVHRQRVSLEYNTVISHLHLHLQSVSVQYLNGGGVQAISKQPRSLARLSRPHSHPGATQDNTGLTGFRPLAPLPSHHIPPSPQPSKPKPKPKDFLLHFPTPNTHPPTLVPFADIDIGHTKHKTSSTYHTHTDSNSTRGKVVYQHFLTESEFIAPRFVSIRTSCHRPSESSLSSQFAFRQPLANQLSPTQLDWNTVFW
ncbi:hypothetical protein HYFRA_00011103 [Hymenoscyphus fraxineus]|uniref:Uncharacterized protein n=1 Tax=Hymenoscyphus fraxineus TaxID=746836 RepID=A0A9N9L4H6_9HELO|nr:hypothetical protein HYFRA_00011103 [Hymenoscyphus fraxineus]